MKIGVFYIAEYNISTTYQLFLLNFRVTKEEQKDLKVVTSNWQRILKNLKNKFENVCFNIKDHKI